MKVFSTYALKPAILAILDGLDCAFVSAIAFEWASTQILAERISAGEKADLVIASAEAIAALSEKDLIERESIRELVRAEIGVAVKAGAAHPDIGSASALESTLLSAKSIAYSRTGVSGLFVSQLIERFGITDALKPKIVTPEPGTPVGALVADGVVELGFQQISELLPVPGVDIVGPLPPGAALISVFSAALTVSGEHRAEMLALIEILVSDASEPAYRRAGLAKVDRINPSRRAAVH